MTATTSGRKLLGVAVVDVVVDDAVADVVVVGGDEGVVDEAVDGTAVVAGGAVALVVVGGDDDGEVVLAAGGRGWPRSSVVSDVTPKLVSVLESAAPSPRYAPDFDLSRICSGFNVIPMPFNFSATRLLSRATVVVGSTETLTTLPAARTVMFMDQAPR
jgi:hypothetical protein